MLIKRKDTTAICSFVVQGLFVLAPLISSEEGRDMNVSAVRQLLSWFTQRGTCLCQAD